MSYFISNGIDFREYLWGLCMGSITRVYFPLELNGVVYAAWCKMMQAHLPCAESAVVQADGAHDRLSPGARTATRLVGARFSGFPRVSACSACSCADSTVMNWEGFEVAPVFRAENSFTHRHMTESVSLFNPSGFLDSVLSCMVFPHWPLNWRMHVRPQNRKVLWTFDLVEY